MKIKTIDSVLNAPSSTTPIRMRTSRSGRRIALAKKIKQVLDYERTYSPETAPVPKKVPRHKRLGPEENQAELETG